MSSFFSIKTILLINPSILLNYFWYKAFLVLLRMSSVLNMIICSCTPSTLPIRALSMLISVVLNSQFDICNVLAVWDSASFFGWLYFLKSSFCLFMDLLILSLLKDSYIKWNKNNYFKYAFGNWWFPFISCMGENLSIILFYEINYSKFQALSKSVSLNYDFCEVLLVSYLLSFVRAARVDIDVSLKHNWI